MYKKIIYPSISSDLFCISSDRGLKKLGEEGVARPNSHVLLPIYNSVYAIIRVYSILY